MTTRRFATLVLAFVLGFATALATRKSPHPIPPPPEVHVFKAEMLEPN